MEAPLPAIYSDGNAALFDGWREPNRVDGIDQGLISVGDNPALGIDYGKPVACVHCAPNVSVGGMRVGLCVHIEQRELELMPLPQRPDGISYGIVVLPGRD